jgi:hypothetical protein
MVEFANAQSLCFHQLQSMPGIRCADCQLALVPAVPSLVRMAMVKADFRSPPRQRDYVATTSTRSKAIRQRVA